MHLQTAHFFSDFAVGRLFICPAVGKDAIDPAFQHAGKRPPVNGINQHQRIGAVNAFLLGQHIGGRRGLTAKQREIGSSVTRIEALCYQVGDFKRVRRANLAG